MVHLGTNDVIREPRLDRYVSILSLFLNILFFQLCPATVLAFLCVRGDEVVRHI
jgi:hypothetical protein